MGIQDRDYFWERRNASVKRTSGFGRSRKSGWLARLTKSPWVIWIALLVAGTLVAKLGLTISRESIPFPPTGAAFWYVKDSEGPRAPLTIHGAPTTGAEHVIRLEQWESRAPVVLIPVRGGERAQLSMPLGTYRLVIISGRGWRGPDRLFAWGTASKESVHPLSFHRSGAALSGHTIQLEVLNGNLETRPSWLK